MWKKLLAGLLIIAGLVLIFSNQINDQYMKYRSRDLTQQVNEVTAEEMKQNNEQILPPALEEEIYDFSQVREASLEETWTSLFERAQDDPLFREYLASAEEVGETGSSAPDPGTTGRSEPDPGMTGASDPGPATGSTGPARTKAAGESTQGSADPDPGSIGPPPTEAEAEEALKKFTRSFYIGVLKIPRINLELGILRGVRNNNLWVGAGTMRPDQVMGQRNYPIAGHHMRAWEVLFNRVPELKNGDLMHMTDKENMYTYRVYQNRKVHETEVSVIYDQVATEQGSPVLTLVTCFHRDEPEARVIIHGELIDVQPYSEAAFRALD